jgi:hypothetical protein
MLSREELKEKNMNFWNDFRKYMNKIKSSNGRRMNWVNYPSDVKNVYVRLVVDSKSAYLSLDIQPKDAGIREILWEQMQELKKVMENSMNYEATWSEEVYTSEGRKYAQIKWELTNVNYFVKEDQAIIFEFLKNRLIEFDEFYQEYKEILISLTD